MGSAEDLLVVRVARKTAETDAISAFELVHPRGADLPAFTAGAHLDVHLPNGLVRQYSLCNDERERHRYVIAVLRDPRSRGGSAAMHDAVHVGHELRVSAPRNHFPLAQAGQAPLLLAGGVGITPLLSMARRLAREGLPYALHYFARTRAAIAFLRELSAPPFAGRVSFHLDDQPGVSLPLADVLDSAAVHRPVYVCGPGGFIDAALDLARARGWQEDRLHCERFAAGPSAAPAGSFEVRIASSGQTLFVPAGKSALQVLREHGLDVPFSCEQGVCGTCLTPVLDGKPDHRDAYLTPAERALNDCFAPCCSRSLTPVLVLGL